MRRTSGVIVIIVLLFIAGFILFSIPWRHKANKTQDIVEQAKLVSYANTDTRVQMIQNGPIVANSDHREVWITVGRDVVEFKVIKGYEQQVIESKTFANNSRSYKSFLGALANVNFDQERNYKGTETEIGSCPTGIRYSFDTFNSDEVKQHTWTTSCFTKVGTYGGTLSSTIKLFTNQVPNYSELTADVDL